MTLKTIRLELARSKEQPVGRSDRGYEFVAPLTDDGHLDLEAWHTHKAKCTVRHFEDGVDTEHGRLVHRGRGWFFHFDGEDGEDGGDDEPIFKFDRHRFTEGEYLSVTEHDGVMRTFKAVRVR